MTKRTHEEIVSLVAKNPAALALFLSRALDEGYHGFMAGHLSPLDLMFAFEGASDILRRYLAGSAHEVEPYRVFVAHLIDSGEITLTGELGRITDPAGPQEPRAVN